jgi:hypothetical protein
LPDDFVGVDGVHDCFPFCCSAISYDSNVITLTGNNNKYIWNNIDEKYSIITPWIAPPR